MITTRPKNKILLLLKSFKNLLGVGLHLLLVGFLLEALTITVWQWVSLGVTQFTFQEAELRNFYSSEFLMVKQDVIEKRKEIGLMRGTKEIK